MAMGSVRFSFASKTSSLIPGLVGALLSAATLAAAPVQAEELSAEQSANPQALAVTDDPVALTMIQEKLSLMRSAQGGPIAREVLGATARRTVAMSSIVESVEEAPQTEGQDQR
jgi:hypothetical protein